MLLGMAWRWLAIVCLMGLAACMAAERESAPEGALDTLALPDEAKVRSGRALPSAISSFTDVAGIEGWTTRT